MDAVAYLERNLDAHTAIDRFVEDRFNPELYITVPAVVNLIDRWAGPSAVRPMFQILPNVTQPGMPDYLDDPTSVIFWSIGCPCQDPARNRPCPEGGHQS